MKKKEVLNEIVKNGNLRKVDEFITKKLFGFVDNPDSLSEDSGNWYWVHPKDGVLLGMSYTSKTMFPTYGHQWEKFCPTKNLEHAFIIIKEMNARNFGFGNRIHSGVKSWFDTSNGMIFTSPILPIEEFALSICHACVETFDD